MKIVPIQDTNIYMFRDMFPSGMIRNQITLFGCVDGETALGTAAFERYEYSGAIPWLYVAPEHRGKGVGGMLLQALLLEEGDMPVDICYDSGEPWAEELGLMLMRRGFILMTQKLPVYRITAEQLRASAALHTDIHSGEREGLIPLAELSPYQFKSLIVECEEAGIFYVSRADYASCDPHLSIMSVDDTEVNGMILIKNQGNGVLELALMYLANHHQMMGLPLIRHTLQNILETVPDLREIHFTCAVEITAQIAERLVPDAEKTWAEAVKGILIAARKKGKQ